MKKVNTKFWCRRLLQTGAGLAAVAAWPIPRPPRQRRQVWCLQAGEDRIVADRLRTILSGR